jgi:hypothetical protein
MPIIASSGMTGDQAEARPEDGLAQVGIKTLLMKPYAEAGLLGALAAELDPVVGD